MRGPGTVSGRFARVMMIVRIRMSVIRGLGIVGMLREGGKELCIRGDLREGVACVARC